MIKARTGGKPRKTTKKYGTSQQGEARIRLERDKKAMMGLVIICILLRYALVSSLLASYGLNEQRPAEALQWFNLLHLAETGNPGRDIFSHIVYGTRASIVVGFIAVGPICTTGTLIGAAAGYCGDKADNTLIRFMDVFMVIPSALLAISITAVLGSGSVNLIIATGASTISSYTRTVRALILTVKDQEYIETVRAGDASGLRIVLRYILPSCLAPAIMRSTLGVTGAILICASLNYVGLSIQSLTFEWGNMLNTGKAYLLGEQYIALFPGPAIMTAILTLNLLGNGLQDTLDPRAKR